VILLKGLGKPSVAIGDLGARAAGDTTYCVRRRCGPLPAFGGDIWDSLFPRRRAVCADLSRRGTTSSLDAARTMRRSKSIGGCTRPIDEGAVDEERRVAPGRDGEPGGPPLPPPPLSPLLPSTHAPPPPPVADLRVGRSFIYISYLRQQFTIASPIGYTAAASVRCRPRILIITGLAPD